MTSPICQRNSDWLASRDPGRRGADMQVCGGADACVARVTPEADAHRLAGADEPDRASDPAQHREIGHDKIGDAESDGASQVGDVGRKGYVRMPPQRRHFLEGRDRILVVAHVVVGEHAQHPARRGQRPLHVGIEPDLGRRPQRLAQPAHGFDFEQRVAADQLALENRAAVLIAHCQAIVDDRFRASSPGLRGSRNIRRT